MSRDRTCLAAVLLLACAALPGIAAAGEPARTTVYQVRGTTIQWNHAASAGSAAVRPRLADELRAQIRARLHGQPAPATNVVEEKLANGMTRVRVPADKYSVLLFQLDPTKGLLGADGVAHLDHGVQTCNEAGRLVPPSRLVRSEAATY